MEFRSVQRITALFVSIITLLCNWLNLPVRPMGQKLDLTGYELVFRDEFDGDALDTEAWSVGCYAENAGFYDGAQITFLNGNAVLTGSYREDGAFGAGWYAADIRLRQTYTRGYFECRCICNDAGGFWSAFWLQSEHSYDHALSAGGVGGAEIDIMEANQYSSANRMRRNAVTSAIHCNGGDNDPDKIDSKRLGKFLGNDIYNAYNIYGLEWTEDEYIYYVNGVETARSTFSKGVSQAPEYVCVSLCVPGTVTMSKDETTRMYVDYVKVYQKP